MNERIKILAEQSTKIEYGGDNGFDCVTFDKEKFAELLIKECADYVQFYYKDHACEIIAHDMKQHFGVE